MVDAGLDIPHGIDVIPTEERITGQHINEEMKSFVEATKANIQEEHA